MNFRTRWPNVGIECGEGWIGILDLLAEKLSPGVKVLQVKEKFGTLRFYINRGTEADHNLISQAEAQSAVTCELCGAEGSIGSNKGWVVCRCKKCK